MRDAADVQLVIDVLQQAGTPMMCVTRA
jgi:hypothetical protein